MLGLKTDGLAAGGFRHGVALAVLGVVVGAVVPKPEYEFCSVALIKQHIAPQSEILSTKIIHDNSVHRDVGQRSGVPVLPFCASNASIAPLQPLLSEV